MPQVEVNGIQIHVQTFGSGPPIIMIHGLLIGNMASWYFGVAAELAKTHEVILYDLRGHGLSEKSQAGYDIATMVADLEALIASRGLKAVSLVGHSYGALVGLHYAIRNPSRVEKIIIVEAPLPPSQGSQMDSFLAKSADEVIAALPEHLKALIFTQTRQAKKFLERLQFLINETELIENLRREQDIPDAILKLMAVPTLLIYSPEAHLESVALRLKNLLPNSRLEWLEGGHYLPSANPQKLSQTIGAFFQ